MFFVFAYSCLAVSPFLLHTCIDVANYFLVTVILRNGLASFTYQHCKLVSRGLDIQQDFSRLE